MSLANRMPRYTRRDVIEFTAASEKLDAIHETLKRTNVQSMPAIERMLIEVQQVLLDRVNRCGTMMAKILGASSAPSPQDAAAEGETPNAPGQEPVAPGDKPQDQ
jgi:hypothetical protein